VRRSRSRASTSVRTLARVSCLWNSLGDPHEDDVVARGLDVGGNAACGIGVCGPRRRPQYISFGGRLRAADIPRIASTREPLSCHGGHLHGVRSAVCSGEKTVEQSSHSEEVGIWRRRGVSRHV
jgi:hypothetical protein